MIKRFGMGVAAGVAIAMTGGVARADYAIVIGINEYKNAPDRNLQGCVNDAKTMAEALRKYGFPEKNILLLTDAQATQAAIMKALQNAPHDPNQRFVFYFAGHGTDKAGWLVTHDAELSNYFKDIDRDALYKAIKAIPAKSRTVILDSCFSGAMSKAFGRGRTRFFPRQKRDRDNAKEWVETAIGQDTNARIGGGSGVCYYTAAQGTQQSNEDEFDSGAHGLFTYFLSRRLTGQMTDWGSLDAAVSGDVAVYAQQRLQTFQTPTLSPAFGKIGLFGSPDNPKPVPNPTVKKTTVWDIFNGKNVDRNRDRKSVV